MTVLYRGVDWGHGGDKTVKLIVEILPDGTRRVIASIDDGKKEGLTPANASPASWKREEAVPHKEGR